MESIASYFNNLNEYSKSQNNQSYEKRQLLVLSTKRNQGNAILRLIPDENGVPMRLIHDVWECYHNFPRVDDEGKPILDNKGEQEWGYEFLSMCGAQNYHDFTLTPEQASLVKETYELVEEYNQLVYEEEIDPEETGLSCTRRSEITLFWAKLIQYSGNSDLQFDTNKPVLIRHHSAKFFQSFCEAQAAKTKMKGSSNWMENYFGRKPGTCNTACSITTTLEQGYKLTIAFDEVADFVITEDFLKEATDLNKEIFDVTKFNEDYYIRIRDIVKEILDEYKKVAAETGGFSDYQDPPKEEATVEGAPKVEAKSEAPKPATKPVTRPAGAPKFGPPSSL